MPRGTRATQSFNTIMVLCGADETFFVFPRHVSNSEIRIHPSEWRWPLKSYKSWRWAIRVKNADRLADSILGIRARVSECFSHYATVFLYVCSAANLSVGLLIVARLYSGSSLIHDVHQLESRSPYIGFDSIYSNRSFLKTTYPPIHNQPRVLAPVYANEPDKVAPIWANRHLTVDGYVPIAERRLFVTPEVSESSWENLKTPINLYSRSPQSYNSTSETTEWRNAAPRSKYRHSTPATGTPLSGVTMSRSMYGYSKRKPKSIFRNYHGVLSPSVGTKLAKFHPPTTRRKGCPAFRVSREHM